MHLKPETIEKLYYSIGEVATILKVNQSKIRFWIKALNIRVGATKGGTRQFTPENLETLLEVKRLSDTGRYTLRGIEIILYEMKIPVMERRKKV